MAEDKKKELKMDELESVSGGYIIHHDFDPNEDQPEPYGELVSFRCKSCGNVFNYFHKIGKCPKCNADVDIYNDYA